MVIAHHLIWTAYGTWLPNDPRGSGSREIISLQLATLGELHFGRKKVQPVGRVIREFYEKAAEKLLFDVIRFNSQQIQIVAESLGEAIRNHRYTCYACAIMPDHIHLVIRKHQHLAEKMIENLQAATRLRLSRMRLITPDHPLWTNGGWKRYLDSPHAVGSAIRYVDRNPRQKQCWPFVREYDGWPLHKRRI